MMEDLVTNSYDWLLLTLHSSALWVQYMAFFLHTAEVEKARSIAKRALATISFRYIYSALLCSIGIVISLQRGTGETECLGCLVKSGECIWHTICSNGCFPGCRSTE